MLRKSIRIKYKHYQFVTKRITDIKLLEYILYVDKIHILGPIFHCVILCTYYLKYVIIIIFLHKIFKIVFRVYCFFVYLRLFTLYLVNDVHVIAIVANDIYIYIYFNDTVVYNIIYVCITLRYIIINNNMDDKMFM